MGVTSIKFYLVRLITFIVFSVLLHSCGGSSSSPNNDGVPPANPDTTDSTALSPPTAVRDWLTKSHLESASYPHTSPIHNDYFMACG